MAVIPQAKPKHEPPVDATLDWLVKDMWSDMKELVKVEGRVKTLEGIVYVVGGIIAGMYIVGHIQEVIDFVIPIIKKAVGL